MTPEELLAFEQARRIGYLVQTPETDTGVVRAFRQWCKEQGKPFVITQSNETSATLTFDTGSVWEHFLPQYQFLRERPSYFTLDPTEELQVQVRRAINASGFQGGAGYGGSYTWIAGLPIEYAEQTAQALLSIWEKALAIHLSRLAQDNATSNG